MDITTLQKSLARERSHIRLDRFTTCPPHHPGRFDTPTTGWFKLRSGEVVKLAHNMSNYVVMGTEQPIVIRPADITHVYQPNLLLWRYYQVLSGNGYMTMANDSQVKEIHIQLPPKIHVSKCRYIAYFRAHPDGIEHIRWDSFGEVISIERTKDIEAAPLDYRDYRLTGFTFYRWVREG